MKVQIVKRGEHFFVRRKGLFGFHIYLTNHILWWSVEFNPNERYYGFPSLEKAKAEVNIYADWQRENKKFLEEQKLKKRLRRNPMIIVEEIMIDV